MNFFFFSPQSCQEERDYKFLWKRQGKENCQLAKGLRKKKKTRAGMEKDECTVGNRLLHMQLASPPSLAWTEGPWTLPANYNWNLPSPTHSLHRMAGPKGWKLQNVNTETRIHWQIQDATNVNWEQFPNINESYHLNNISFQSSLCSFYWVKSNAS